MLTKHIPLSTIAKLNLTVQKFALETFDDICHLTQNLWLQLDHCSGLLEGVWLKVVEVAWNSHVNPVGRRMSLQKQ